MEDIDIKFLVIPKGKGYWASIFLTLGLVTFICAGTFVIANILFSALGVMLFSGGKVIWDYSNMWFPTFTILQGGKIGLLLGLLGGILASISQIRLWIVPTKGAKTISERKGLFLLLSIAFVLYDLLSTYYFVNSGTFFDNSQGFLNGVGSLFLSLGIAGALFSIGPIILLVWALETIIENHKEGIPAFVTGLGTFINVFTKMFGSIQKAFEWELENSESTNEEHSNREEKRGRGRPSSNNREYSGNEVDL